MPNLEQYEQSRLVKALILGVSGSGKTGGLTSLVEAGYNLYILDFDSGLGYLTGWLKKNRPELLNHVHFERITTDLSIIGGTLRMVGTPLFYTKAIKTIAQWEKEKVLNENSILVIDSVTMLSSLITKHVQALDGKFEGPPNQKHYGAVAAMLKDFFSYLYSDKLPTNVLVHAHIHEDTNETGAIISKAPEVIGGTLRRGLPAYFDDMWLLERRGGKRVYITTGMPMLELKASDPDVPAKVEHPDGLAQIFEIIRKTKPERGTKPVLKGDSK
jgi:hypothetical protein